MNISHDYGVIMCYSHNWFVILMKFSISLRPFKNQILFKWKLSLCKTAWVEMRIVCVDLQVFGHKGSKAGWLHNVSLFCWAFFFFGMVFIFRFVSLVFTKSEMVPDTLMLSVPETVSSGICFQWMWLNNIKRMSGGGNEDYAVAKGKPEGLSPKVACLYCYFF